MLHCLESLPEDFVNICAGIQNFTFTRDDRNYQVGDTLRLEECSLSGSYTGDFVYREVACVLRNCPRIGIIEGFVFLEFK